MLNKFFICIYLDQIHKVSLVLSGWKLENEKNNTNYGSLKKKQQKKHTSAKQYNPAHLKVWKRRFSIIKFFLNMNFSISYFFLNSQVKTMSSYLQRHNKIK